MTYTVPLHVVSEFFSGAIHTKMDNTYGDAGSVVSPDRSSLTRCAPPNGDALTTTPDIRLGGPDRTASECGGVSLGVGRIPAAHVPQRLVTAEQLDQAVRQLRERRGRPAAEQMQAVLRALDLTVAPRNEHRR